MKRVPLFTGAALLLLASSAHAGGGEVSQTNALGLGWHGCTSANPLGASDVRFACEGEVANACRVFRLMPTFVSSITDAGFAGSEVDIDVLIGSGPTIGQWWAGMGPGRCRPVDALTTSGYIDAPSLPTPGACRNVYPVNAGNLFIQNTWPTSQPNRFRIFSINCVNPPQPLTTGERTYGMQLVLKTEGTLADCDPTVDPTPVCTEGCSTPACFVLNGVSIYMVVDPGDGPRGTGSSNPNPDIIHYTHDGGASRNWVTYQGGSCGGALGLTPTRTTTWGAIKSLYR